MSRLNKKRAMILYENNAYGRGLAESFRRGFTGEVVGMDPVSDRSGEDLEPFVRDRLAALDREAVRPSGEALLRPLDGGEPSLEV